MILTEYQAKNILRKSGIRVPAGLLAESAQQAENVALQMGGGPWMVKAQIRAGGRAKGHFPAHNDTNGGIRVADTPDDVAVHARKMLGDLLVTRQTGKAGELVTSVYIEQLASVTAEMYLALAIDRELGVVTFITSKSGGSDIELIAAQSPEVVARFPVDIDSLSVPPDVVEYFGLDSHLQTELASVMATMLDVFVDRDATLIELNPLCTNESGQLIALDAAIIWDDNALFRQGHEEQMQAYDHLPECEFDAIKHGLNYVKLDGNIGCLSAGAGLAMATIDAIKECGGHPANFLDIPPAASVDQIKIALELLLVDDAIQGILLNVFGGGIMRCDAIADALLLANRRQAFSVPVVVRLAGINSTLALQRIASSLPMVVITDDLANAAQTVVALTELQLKRRKTEAIDNKSAWWRKVHSLFPESTE